ncbi:S-adenosyl-L-methionine-dependent methyltransferase, partial [Pisolithus marmoratus]
PPDCCHVCDIVKQYDHDLLAHPVNNGVAWHAREYHIDDFVLIKAEDGPCIIGHIRDIFLAPDSADEDDNKIVVTLLGRVDKVSCRPETVLKDERHLFYTNERMRIVISDVVGICFVLVSSSLPEIEDWKAVSPIHFYIKYRSPVLDVRSWDGMQEMPPQALDVCKRCLEPNLKNFRELHDYFERGPQLRVFDPFAGVGAFTMAMEMERCFKLTHAIEISPSAAQTLRNTTADTKVYNQCSNRLLRQAILLHEGKDPDPLRAINGDALPDPPMPGDIDCIVTGFPCQPHSQLNMFQKANDRKSNLILNILSWVDFLKPKYCIFENVRGFLAYNLKARQDGPHRLKGGIPMGGLNYSYERSPTWSIYQLRFSLLQAGHYGTPQTRVRFFLVAAKRGSELPELPQPTHDFPVADKLEIKFSNGNSIEPIRTVPGIAPHRYVSTHDAISDLPVFHWKHPKRNYTRQEMRAQKLIECDESRPWCGLSGPDVSYEHDPQTSFQLWCRKKATRDLQQYTRTYEPKKVERVVEIPLQDDADYRTLRPDLWEWQFHNPLSASARGGFRPGYYGRVSKDRWFQTTVTNVDPTAKQCRVLHPYVRKL